jgi:hypothetical protein
VTTGNGRGVLLDVPEGMRCEVMKGLRRADGGRGDGEREYDRKGGRRVRSLGGDSGFVGLNRIKK